MLIGQVLGNYEIRRELGRGGMAEVYLAYQPQMEREVALKVLSPRFTGDATFIARFEQEAKAAAKLTHPHIVPIYDYGTAGDQTFIAMAYLSGGTLGDLMAARGSAMQVDDVAFILSQIGQALDYAHSQGIIHRDVKPSNILMDEQGNVYLADFGLAKVAERVTQLTGSGIVGTPAYMAPEQVDTDQEVTSSADLYALGIIAFQALVGEVPYQASTPVKQLMAHVLKPVPSARQLNANIPPAIDAVLTKALAKHPADRYPTARDLALALQSSVDPGSRRGATGLLSPDILERYEEAARTDASSSMRHVLQIVTPPQEDESDADQVFDRQPSTITEPEIAFISGGPFLMGSDYRQDPAADRNEKPQIQVDLPAYSIGRFPVTVGEYRTFIEADGYHTERYWTPQAWAWRKERRSNNLPRFWKEDLWTDDPRLPVNGVSWYEACAYCRWLSEMTGIDYRLPTEAQWEKAARGLDARIYPWGNDAPGLAHCNTFGAVGRTSPVGAYSPTGDSPFGVSDMSGNVWEWCLTKWRSSYQEPEDNDETDDGSKRVLRGGSWFSDADLARSAHRSSSSPGDRRFDIGFRVVALLTD